MFKRLITAGLIVAAISASSSAQAVQYIFTLTGPTTLVFAIDKLTTPSASTSTTAVFDNVSGSYDGSFGGATITFGSDTRSPVLQIDTGAGSPLSFFGSALFVGNPSRARFAEGGYSLSSIFGQALLNVRESVGSPDPLPGEGGGIGATVPEPATWALMIGGFAAVGITQRRRARTAVAY